MLGGLPNRRAIQEFDTVVVQQDIFNGCGYRAPAFPLGVVDLNPYDGKAHKCMLCYDRMKDSLEPACAKSCATNLPAAPALPQRRTDKGLLAGVLMMAALGVAAAQSYAVGQNR